MRRERPLQSGADHCLLRQIPASLSELVSLEQGAVSGSVFFRDPLKVDL